MAEINIGNQRITPKYAMPLTSVQLSKQMHGLTYPGCADDMDITVNGASVIIPPATYYVRDSGGITGGLYEVTTVENTIFQIDTTIKAIGLKFEFQSMGSWWADLSLLTETSMVDFPGIIICGIYFDGVNVHVNKDMADKVPILFSKLQQNPVAMLRPISPRGNKKTSGDTAYSPTLYSLYDGNTATDPYLVTVLNNENSSASLRLGETLLDFNGLHDIHGNLITTGNYCLVGYAKSYTPSVPATIPIEVYSQDADRDTAISEHNSKYICLAVIHWTGNNMTSTIEYVKHDVKDMSDADAYVNGLLSRYSNVSVTVATVSQIVLADYPVIDSYQTVDNDIILVKNQNNDFRENGLYVVSSGSWVRAAQALTHCIFIPGNGTVNIGKGFYIPTDTVKVGEQRVVVLPATIRNELVDTIYPVGAIYMSIAPTHPSILFGGVWEKWGAGRVPVGVDTAQTEFDTVEKEDGEKTHSLTVQEMPRHTHTQAPHNHSIPGTLQAANSYGNINNPLATSAASTVAGYKYADDNTAINQYTGGEATTQAVADGKAFVNLPPYITCYMWKRTA